MTSRLEIDVEKGKYTSVRVEAYGREIVLTIGERDDCYQFRLAVAVDGTERFAAHFTDKEE